MTSFGGEVVPITTQSAGFSEWTTIQASPTAWPTQVQPEQPTMPAPTDLSSAGALPQPSVWSGDGEVLRQQAAAALQRCYHWLEAVMPIVPQVSWVVPIVVTAVQQYEAQQYEASLYQSLAVIQAVRQVQAMVPTLPPL